MMEFFNKLRGTIEQAESRIVNRYIYIILGFLLLISSLLVYQYYRTINYWTRQIRNTNELREEVRIILEKNAEVKLQRAAVDALLAEDENFKISGYFQELLNSLNIANKKTDSETESQDREDNYRADILRAKFTDMSTQEVAELLQELEKNPRLYTSELEIKQSKKTPNSLDVSISIGTLQPKLATSAE